MVSRARRFGKSVHSLEQAAFRELLIGARDDAGLTQQKLAKKLGKHQSFVAKYEGGERRIDVIEFLTITRAIGADPVRLLKALIARIG
jgi:transcriptional regulator with XRE-family HTH domain